MRFTGASLRALALALALVAAVATAGSAAAAEAVLPSGDRLHWDDGLDYGAHRVRKALPSIRKRVAVELGMPEPGPADIHIVSGWDRIREVVGPTVPEWAAGVCAGGRGLVALRADLADNRLLLRSLESVLRHEWIHFAWSQAAGKSARNLPLWVEEGLAEMVGGGFSADAGAQLDLAVAFETLIPFEEIARSWPRKQTRAALAYLQSRHWVEYFIQDQGVVTFRKILAEVAGKTRVPADGSIHGPPFEAAVWRHTERPLSLWIEDWRADLEARARPWYAHLLQNDLFTTLVFIAGIVGGISYFFIRRRRRRQIAQMPDHDFPPGFGGSEAGARRAGAQKS